MGEVTGSLESAVRRGEPSWFGPERAPALEDFWSVYDLAFDEINEETLALTKDHPEFGPIIRAMSPEQMVEQRDRSRKELLRAIRGNWVEYEASLRTQGAVYARMGITFAGWYDIVRAFHGLLVPKLVSTYGAD